MGTLQLGPMIIKYEWIIFLFSSFIVYLVLRIWLKEDDQFRQKFIDTIFNTVFIGFLTYKFSLILFKPIMIIENPSSILFYTGGTKGVLLGVILSVIYIIWKTKREKWKTSVVLTGIFYTITTLITSFWFMRTLLYFIL